MMHARPRGNETVTKPKLVASPYPRAVGSAMLLAAKARVALWDLALMRVEHAQTKQLTGILQHAKDTDFGRRHGFAHVRSHREFAERVPIGDYDTFSPYIDRMRAGERGLLVPEFVKYYGNSSGSSTQGKSKFLPITERQIAFQRGSGADALMRYLAWRNDAHFPEGFTLGLFPPTTMKSEGPVLVTCNPALMLTKLPAITRPVYLPKGDVRDIPDYEQKLERIADLYLDHDVRAVAGTTCWFTLLFDHLLAAARRRGRRADTVSDLWPNLRVLIGGGVSKDPYMAGISERMGNDFALVDTYNATEGGVYAASDHSGERGMRMIVDRGVFFEFVEVGELEKSSPKRVPLWDVQKDVNYAIIVTSPSGLYAYKLGDIVRFSSLDPLRIEFAGRLAGCLSTTQELTTHLEIERAMAHAIAQTGVRTVDFGCGADVGVEGSAKSRYVLFVEPASGSALPADFAKHFDEGLCRENRVYREHRSKDAAILAPEVVALPPGSVDRYLKEVSGGNVQSKFPRILSDERKAILRRFSRS